MQTSKTVAAVVLVVAAVALSGCAGGGEDPATTTTTPAIDPYDGDRSAADIGAVALNRTANATAYRVSVDSEIGLSLGTVRTTIDGTVDRERNRARLNTTVESGFTESRTIQTFFDNGTVYVKESAEVGWQRRGGGNTTPGQPGGPSGVDQFGQQRQLLTAMDLSIVGTTTLNGEEMYVLRGQPDAEAVAGAITGQNAVPGNGLTAENATATLYVATGTDLLRQVTIRAEATAQDQTVTVRSTTRFFDYGIDPDLQPPTVGTATT